MRRRMLWIGTALAVLAGAGALAWTQKDELWVWWRSRDLEKASPEELERAVDELQAFEAIAVPALVRQLSSSDDKLCAGSGRALARLLVRREPGDPWAEQLLDLLADRFGRLSPEGQKQTLLLARERLLAAGEQATPKLLSACVRTVQGAERFADDRRLPALRLGLLLLSTAAEEPTRMSCHALARPALRSANAEERRLAVQIAGFPTLGLMEELLPLASGPSADASPEVRAMVILTLGGREQLLPTEALLPLLHDPDEEVRTVADQALRTRGLPPAQLRLAKMLADPDPSVRARVPMRLLEAPELDTALWLERLSRDPNPSVRAAALRVAGETTEPRWRERLKQAAEQDASPTVKDIARYYRQEPDHR